MLNIFYKHASYNLRKLKFLLLMTLFISTSSTYAERPLEVEKVVDNVYALVGELDQRSPENFGNNSTHGVIITDEGVILVDPGGSYLGAKQIHMAIKKLTDKPVKIIINTGGQDHRWLGNDYFKKLGARIISSEKTHTDQIARESYHLSRLDELIGKSLQGTVPLYSTETFDTTKKIEFGGIELELYHFGAAHTVGDIIVWLPKKKVMFTGDVVFVERALGTGPAKNVKSWINVFEKMASFNPEHIVPGHGHSTNLDEATKDTYDYLVFLRKAVGDVIENDGDMQSATKIDQSHFSYLKVFEGISKKNAQNLFEQMEFE